MILLRPNLLLNRDIFQHSEGMLSTVANMKMDM